MGVSGFNRGLTTPIKYINLQYTSIRGIYEGKTSYTRDNGLLGIAWNERDV